VTWAAADKHTDIACDISSNRPHLRTACMRCGVKGLSFYDHNIYMHVQNPLLKLMVCRPNNPIPVSL